VPYASIVPATKDQILAEIRRTAAENDGVPLGQERFEKESAISAGSWRGKYWRRWSEAIAEAGLTPNKVNEAHSRETLIAALIDLIRRNQRFPTYADMRMAKNESATFPGHMALQNLGNLAERIEMVRAHVIANPEFADVLALLPAADRDASEAPNETNDDEATEHEDGAVYMLKLGKHYKIGKTFSVPRRHREISLELPEKPDIVHAIQTDDPTGIETYWHSRFASKRTNGEWFALTRDDVRAFKRRRFM
jgi:hypothetical protein